MPESWNLQDRFAPSNACFGCGPANARGLRIKSVVAQPAASGLAGDVVTCTWTPEKHHEAFEGMLNGGICGALLDCHSNWAAAWHLMQRRVQSGVVLTEPPCTVTAEFHVKLKRPTPTTTGPLEMTARVVESSDDSATVEAELWASVKGERKVTATCRGVFVAVKEGHPAFHRW